MKTPICLIVPPSGFLADERVFPSLGLAKVAAMLKKSEQYDIAFLDLSGISNYQEIVAYYTAYHNPSYFGITCTTPQFPYVEKIIAVIRSLCNAKIIIGGPHATGIISAYKKNTNDRVIPHYLSLLRSCDAVVAGDGELSIFKALESDSPHVIDGDDMESSFFLQRGTLERYPFPDREFFDRTNN